MATKREVLRANLTEWLALKRYSKERGILRDRLAETVKMHRNSVARSMRRIQLERRDGTERRGRPKTYTKDVEAALCAIWEAMDKPCAEVLHPMIDAYLVAFVNAGRWHYHDMTEALVKSMSIGSIKTRIRIWREKEGATRGYSATRSSPLKVLIPIRKSHTWQSLPAGYLQMDTVVHCGDLLTGDVVYSVGGVDFATYWTEYTAQWTKGKEATRESIEMLLERFPFAIIEIHPDTGDEFVNYHVHGWATERGVRMTRSEPYKKNDNMCIEERNNTIPRRHLGYVRLDAVSLVPIAAKILRLASTMHNHFRPVRRQTLKVRIGAKWKRTYEKAAMTPYERVLGRGDISTEAKAELTALHAALDPLHLKEELDTLKSELYQKISKLNARKV